MIFSAAGQASSRRRPYRGGRRNDNRQIAKLWLHNPRGNLAAQTLQAVQRVGAGLRQTSMPLMTKCLRKKSWCTALSWNCCGAHTENHVVSTARPSAGSRCRRRIRGGRYRHRPRVPPPRPRCSAASWRAVAQFLQGDPRTSRHLEQVDLRARDMARLDPLRGRRCGHSSTTSRCQEPLHESNRLRLTKRGWASSGVSEIELRFGGF